MMQGEQQEAFNGEIKAIFRGGKINKIKWGDESFAREVTIRPSDRQGCLEVDQRYHGLEQDDMILISNCEESQINGHYTVIRVIDEGCYLIKSDINLTSSRNALVTTGWNAWDTKRKLTYAMELASAMNQAAEKIQNQRNKMAEDLDLIQRKYENALQAVDIQKEIVRNTITTDNAVKQKYIEDIQQLQRENKQLREQLNAHNDQLAG